MFKQFAEQELTLRDVQAWLMTDGKTGDEVQCLGIAEALGLSFEHRHVKPRPLYAWAMPHGPIDPKEDPGQPQSPIAPPYPDLVIATGRRTVPYLKEIKKRSMGRCFTVFLKDPRIGGKAADFIWVPEHDRLRGENILATLTSPHRISPQRLAEARADPDPRLTGLRMPRVALLLGGDTKSYTYSGHDIADLIRLLSLVIEDSGGRRRLDRSAGSIMVSATRRTPPSLAKAVRALVDSHQGFFWDGEGPNPYLSMLALAEQIIVTADSVNMVGEAVATGKPTYIFRPSGGSRKIEGFLQALEGKGAVRNLTGHLETWLYEPIDSVPEIASEIRRRFLAHQARLTRQG